MSVKAMTWVWDLADLNTGQTMVLLVLADMANDDGFYCWPGQETLAHKSRMTPRNVRRHLQFLEAQGLVSVERRSTTEGRKSNLYRLNVGMEWHLVCAGQTQPDNLSPCGEGSESLPVDNSYLRRSDATGQSVPLGLQPDTGVLSQPDASVRLPPYSVLNRNCEPPDQTRPYGAERSTMVGSGRVGDILDAGAQGRGGAPAAPPPTAGPSVHSADLSLIGACLPPPMQVLDALGARMVASVLGERVSAGWRPEEIRALMDQPLPHGGVGRMSALVASRLRCNVDPALAPSRLRSQPRPAEPHRSAPVAVEDQGVVDPEWEQAWSWVERAHPEASRREQVALAEARVGELRGGEGA